MSHVVRIARVCTSSLVNRVLPGAAHLFISYYQSNQPKRLISRSTSRSMAAIQILSDLHLEAPKAYDTFTITPAAPYLALLGDIGNAGAHREEMFAFLTHQLRAFRAIFFIPGNHEAYHSTWPETLSALRDFEMAIALRQENDPSLGLFVLMNRASFRIPSNLSGSGDMLVLGCSLFSHVPSSRSADVALRLNDFYNTGDEWDVRAHNAAHKRDVAWLNEQVANADRDSSIKDVVILTHWSPSLDERALEPRHKGSTVESAFSTDLTCEGCWLGSKVKVWACGHTHFNFEFLADRGEGRVPLRIVTNQRGYYFRPSERFDARKIIKLGSEI